MKIEISRPGTTEKFSTNFNEIDLESLKKKLAPNVPVSTLDDLIDNLNISAEAKAILVKIKNTTIKIGNSLLKTGNSIIESFVYFIKKFPKATVGSIVGLAIGCLVSMIPILGLVLGPLLTPLLTALGLAVGYWHDLKDSGLKDSIESHINEVFGDLKNVPVKS